MFRRKSCEALSQHCTLIAVRDSSDQHLIWCRLHFGLVTLVASDYRWVQASARDGPQCTRVRSLSGRLYRPWGFPVAPGYLLRLCLSPLAKYTLICEKPSCVPAPIHGLSGEGTLH